MTDETGRLWYHESIGVPQHAENARGSHPSVRVGLIDTGCDSTHPYLRGRVIDEIDFAASSRGVVYCDDVSAPVTSTEGDHGTPDRSVVHRGDTSVLRPFAAIDRKFKELGIEPKYFTESTEQNAATFERILSDLKKQGPPVKYPIENPAHFFGSHGTSCAGLVAGAVKSEFSRKLVGVFPEAEIVSISTPFSPEAGPIIRALLYCVVKEVDVILLPRSITKLHGGGESSNGASPDSSGDSTSAAGDGGERDSGGDSKRAAGDNGEHDASALDARKEARASRLTAKTSNTDESGLLEQLLLLLADKIPIVLAAGNSGLAEPEYPGNLAKRDSSLIVVGAHNSLGRKSTYSSGDNGSVTLFGPSDDSETVADRVRRQRGENLLDTDSPKNDGEACQRPEGLRSLAASATVRDTLAYSTYRAEDDSCRGKSELGLSASDGPFQDFGGTSAASSIIAGSVAFLQYENKRKGGTSLTGEEVKARLTARYPEGNAARVNGLPTMCLSDS